MNKHTDDLVLINEIESRLKELRDRHRAYSTKRVAAKRCLSELQHAWKTDQ